MKSNMFIDSVMRELGRTDSEDIEFYYHTPESKFLYNFRERHNGDYHNYCRNNDRYRLWVMLQHPDKPKIEMQITNISTAFSRKVAINICNRIIDEINDIMACRHGKRAIFIPHVVDPKLINKVFV